MKKLLAALIVITMVLLSGQAYTKDVLYKENASTILSESEDKVILNVPILKETDESGSITYSKDREGNLYGPTDYAIDGNSILILNTTKNSIMVYNDGKYSQTLSLEGFEFYGTRIASANGIHYVLGNNLTVLVLKPDSKPFIVDISKIVIDEAIFEFQAINEYLYITDATSTTYKLCLREENFNLENKYSGYFVDNNTIQVKTTINYLNQDQTVTNYVIDLLDLSLNKNISINFKLENTGYAAKYLGIDPSGYYRVKIYEYLVNEDGSTQCNESIVLIDKTGTVIAQKILETPYMSILGQTKLVNGKIYHLNNTLEAFSINEIMISLTH
ncbi:MAG TPA: hypothetical protein VFD03_09885 [Clostridia bacterium]|nr:hypothetical protein [Clostridia bacterium]